MTIGLLLVQVLLYYFLYVIFVAAMNERSSRSHAIFMVFVKQINKETKSSKLGLLIFVVNNLCIFFFLPLFAACYFPL
jgi:hypothetical protein